MTMMKSSAIIPISIAAVIHLLPLPGLLGRSTLERLYGVRMKDAKKNDDESDGTTPLLIALQHRAVMLGSLGMGLGIGAFWHATSLDLAIGLTLLSDVSFLAVAVPRWSKLNAKMKKVVYADVVSIVCLGMAILSVNGGGKRATAK